MRYSENFSFLLALNVCSNETTEHKIGLFRIFVEQYYFNYLFFSFILDSYQLIIKHTLGSSNDLMTMLDLKTKIKSKFLLKRNIFVFVN